MLWSNSFSQFADVRIWNWQRPDTGNLLGSEMSVQNLPYFTAQLVTFLWISISLGFLEEALKETLCIMFQLKSVI